MAQLIIETYPPLDVLAWEETIEGKFVQFRWQGNEYLLFATREEYRFHNHMLARFMADHELPHRWSDEETLEFEVPELDIHGGGRFRFTREPPQLELWDNSQAYGKFRETGLATSIRASGHPFSKGRISIR